MTIMRHRIPSSAPKFLAFALVTSLLVGLLATLVGNLSFAPRHDFHALFSDAAGVFPGDRVRLAGVEVGRVDGVTMHRAGEAELADVAFSVDKSVPLLTNAHLTLRYENIVGQRYLAIGETVGSASEMPPGGTFPTSQTTPALSLTELFNGFQPLFQALDPKQVNTFSFELIRALQGESVSVGQLMADTATLTNSLADRDQVIGRVITNLGDVLTTVGRRDGQLSQLIIQFQRLMTGLATDRDAISRSLPSLSGLLGDTAGLVREVRKPLAADIGSLGKVAAHLSSDSATLNASLQRLPSHLATFIRTASYGSWFNFYVCGLNVQLQLLGGQVDLQGAGLAANERDTVCGKADR